MGKAVLHNLIDMLNETDTETIYNVLIKFVPGVKPYTDEIGAKNRQRLTLLMAM